MNVPEGSPSSNEGNNQTLDEALFAMRRQGDLEKIKEELLDRLILYGVQFRVVDNDKTREGALQLEFIQAYRENMLQYLPPRPVQESDYSRISVEALVAYYDERTYQCIAVHGAATLANAYHNDLSSEVATYLAQNTKKELQAEFFVHYGRSMNDPVQQFFNNEAPGPGLDPTNPEDRIFIIQAEKDLKNFTDARLKRQAIIERCREMMGIAYDVSSENEMVDATQVLIEMHIIASTMHKSSEASRRSEALRDYARGLDCDEAVIARIVDLFEDQYPLGLSLGNRYLAEG
jgi:hypothetical protein